jgi:hypothetical protein
MEPGGYSQYGIGLRSYSTMIRTKSWPSKYPTTRRPGLYYIQELEFIPVPAPASCNANTPAQCQYSKYHGASSSHCILVPDRHDNTTVSTTKLRTVSSGRYHNHQYHHRHSRHMVAPSTCKGHYQYYRAVRYDTV